MSQMYGTSFMFVSQSRQFNYQFVALLLYFLFFTSLLLTQCCVNHGSYDYGGISDCKLMGQVQFNSIQSDYRAAKG